MKSKIFLVISALLLLLSCWNCGNPKPTDSVALIKPPSAQKSSVIFSLNLLSNINEGRWGTTDSLQAQAIRGVNNVLQNPAARQLIGTWTPVWGPVTYTNDSTSQPDTCVSDNTMMLLKGTDPDDSSQTMYVLAIAGTIGNSGFDWASEDFVVNTMCLWPAPVDSGNNVSAFTPANMDTSSLDTITNTGSYISLGTATGLNILLNIMQDGSKGTVLNYLKSIAGDSASSFELAVAGHSLGGALSPCVALSLVDNQQYWNPSGNCAVSCYATAGFSPGNQNFASYFSSKMDSSFFGAANANDVAIHAFQASTMNLIGTLYDTVNGQVYPGLQNQCMMGGIFSCMNTAISNLNYTSLYNQSQMFNGTVNLNGDSISAIYNAAYNSYFSLSSSTRFVFYAASNTYCSNPSNAPDSLYQQEYGRSVCFITMTFEQHFNAYISQFDITPFNAIYQQQLMTGPTPTCLQQDVINDLLTNNLTATCISGTAN